jgi:hypothetical protein
MLVLLLMNKQNLKLQGNEIFKIKLIIMKDIYYKVADRSDEQINSFKDRYELITQDNIIDVFSKN